MNYEKKEFGQCRMDILVGTIGISGHYSNDAWYRCPSSLQTVSIGCTGTYLLPVGQWHVSSDNV